MRTGKTVQEEKIMAFPERDAEKKKKVEVAFST